MKQTKTVTHEIYNRIPAGRFVGGIEQIRHDKVGERIFTYIFEVIDTTTLKINGTAYKVEDNREFAIKIMKTKIKAIDGAAGLVKFFMSEKFDSWEQKVIENCKPINPNK